MEDVCANIQVAKPIEIVQNLYTIEKRYLDSKDRLDGLIDDLDDHSDLIKETEKKVEKKLFSSSPSKSDLFKLIKSDQTSNSKSVETIGYMIRGVNDNTIELARMVQGLSYLSALEYNDICKNTESLNDIHSLLAQNFDKDNIQQSQLNQVVGLHIERAKKYSEKEEVLNKRLVGIEGKIDDLDSYINNLIFLKELNEKLDSESINSLKELNEKLDNENINFLKELSEKLDNENINFLKELNEKLDNENINFLKELSEKLDNENINFLKELNEKLDNENINFIKELSEKLDSKDIELKSSKRVKLISLIGLITSCICLISVILIFVIIL